MFYPWLKELGHNQQASGAHSAPQPTGSLWRMCLPFSTKHSSVRITSSKLTTEPQRNTLLLCQINRTNEMKWKEGSFEKGKQLWKSHLWFSSPSFFSEEAVPCFYSSHFYCQSDEKQPCKRVPGDSSGPVVCVKAQPASAPRNFSSFLCLGDFYSEKMQMNLRWFRFRCLMCQNGQNSPSQKHGFGLYIIKWISTIRTE